MIKTYAGIPYEEIVRRYADDITRLCVVWTQNEEAAKDCLNNPASMSRLSGNRKPQIRF